MLLLLVAACAWWGAAVRADRFDDGAVLPAGVRAGTLAVPVGERVVLWSSAGDGVRPRCTARDLTFDQQLLLSEPAHDYRRGVAGGALDAVLPSRWTPVAVLHTGGDRLRLTCDPASAGDLAVSTASPVASGFAGLRHGWNPLALSAAVMTFCGAGLLAGALGQARRGQGRVRPVPERPAPAHPGPRPEPLRPATTHRTTVRVPAQRRPARTAPVSYRKSISSMSVSVPSERNRSSS